MFCKNCGKEINDNAAICIHCGVQLQETPVAVEEKKNPFATQYCRNCGKEIDINAAVCIHCGVWVKENAPTAKQEAKNGMAIAGFVCSFFVPLLGWIFGGIGLNKASKNGGKGKGFSIAALAIASANFIISFILEMSQAGL